MPLTVKVNGVMNGLVHKGSNHLANSTAPDVCKTPSPGGPAPVPYPVIISLSSDLANGTTTVTADGEMAAIKDCEYAQCTGDEPGTAGGVVSSTFKKEAKFILYSFDVKMDGKNVCRFGDKMTMNHQNTVCMAGTVPTVVITGGANPLPIPCASFTSKTGPQKGQGFTDCEKKQICAKCDELNKQAQTSGRLQRQSGAAQKSARKIGNRANGRLRNAYAEFISATPADRQRGQIGSNSWHPCVGEEWNGDTRMGGLEPDHVHEIQLGGSPSDFENYKWMSRRPNGWLGSTLHKYDPNTHTGVKPDCC
jgi:hypothetical protein